MHHLASPWKPEGIDRSHASRTKGENQSFYNRNVSYHYIILKSGDVLNLRKEEEEGWATRLWNDGSIQIALEGNFENESPTTQQYIELAGLIKDIRSRRGDIKAFGHGDLDGEHTRCPGSLFDRNKVSYYLTDAPKSRVQVLKRDAFNRTNPTGCHEFSVTRYYSPLPNQPEYSKAGVSGVRRTYEQEIMMQGRGTHTSTGLPLTQDYAYKIAACPMKSRATRGLKLRMQTTLGEKIVECKDTGGAIKGFRVDIWAGFGHSALQSIEKGLGLIPDRKVTICF